jgi:hypothetical protein
MPGENNIKIKPQRKMGVRLLKWVLPIAAVLIVSAFLLVPVLVSSGAVRRIILAKVNKAANGRANFAALSMGWYKGIKITDFSFNDNAGQASVQVKQISTKPHYGSIVMGDLSFGQTVIDQPQVQINLKAEQPVRTASVVPPAQKSPVFALPIKTIDLVVNNGSFKVTDQQSRTVSLSQINSQVSLRPPNQRSSFNISMAVADAGKESTIKAGGQVQPGGGSKGWTLKGTTGNLTIEVNDLDLESLGPILELAKIQVRAQGLVSADVNGVIKDGAFENLSGIVRARNLDIGGPQLKGDRLKTSLLDVTVKLRSRQQFIDIEKLQVDSDWLRAKAGGMVPTTFKSWGDILSGKSDYSLSADFEVDVDKVLSQMPHTFGLKEQMKVTSGKLTGNIQASRGRLVGQASLTGLAGVVDGKKLALSEPVAAKLQITAEKEKINFEALNVSAAFAKINATGSLEQLSYDGQFDLAKLQAELGQFANLGPYRLAGELLGKGQISVVKDKITATGSSQAKNLAVSSDKGVSAAEPLADVTFAVNIDRPNSILTIDSIKASAGLGQVSIKDAVVTLGEKAAKPMKLVAFASNVDLQKVQPFAVLFASFPEKMQLAGIAESQVQVTSEKGSYRITTDATKIKNFKLVSPDEKPFEQDSVLFIFDGDYNPTEGNWAVRNLQLTSPDIKLKFSSEKSVQGGKTKLGGLIDCEYDWAAVSAVASGFLPQGFELSGQRKSAISFSSEYPVGKADQLLAHLNAKTKLGFERAAYLGLNFSPTEVDVQVENGVLRIAPFSSKVNNGQLSFAGQADFTKKPVILRTPGPIQVAKDVQINKETTEKLLMYVNPIFANAVNVSGVANFGCEKLAIPLAGAAGKDIEVIGTISMNNVRLEASDLLGQILSTGGGGLGGQVITIHPTKFVLQDGFLRYDDMQVDIGDNPINFKGVIGLDKSLSMTVTLPYTVDGRTVRVGKDTVGQRVSVPLKGTLQKPELDLGGLLQDQLKKQLEEQLRKGLERILR